MSTPKNFGFGEEEQMLRDAARRFFETNLPADALHRMVAENPDPAKGPVCFWDKSLWSQICELGWTAVAVPERAGGLGMGYVAVAALAEEAGRAAFPSPLIPTLQATALLAACETAAADAELAAVVEGKALSLALTNQRGAWNDGAAPFTVTDGRVSGTAHFVQDASKVDAFVLRASTPDGQKLYVVQADAAGLTLHADAIVDLTRDQARLSLESVEAVEVGAQASEVITAAEPAMYIILAADMCGAGEWLLQTTTEYAKVRKQFDHEIGFFQAVKHPLVNVMMDIDIARSHLYNAACAIDAEPASAPVAAHMAKAAASDMAHFSASRAVQFHGGIGFTWECYVHLFFKRQSHNAMLMGDGAWHRARLADLVLGPVAA